MPLNPCKAEKLHSFGNVSRNAAKTNITFIVALSKHMLPKAAARRLALPSQRKPSRFIQGHTTFPPPFFSRVLRTMTCRHC
jgi:hypothetical protein